MNVLNYQIIVLSFSRFGIHETVGTKMQPRKKIFLAQIRVILHTKHVLMFGHSICIHKHRYEQSNACVI